MKTIDYLMVATMIDYFFWETDSFVAAGLENEPLNRLWEFMDIDNHPNYRTVRGYTNGYIRVEAHPVFE